MYGLENLLLNQSGDSSWYNFGYWTEADISYETACRNLALLLSEAAALSEARTVFDIGGGCGDQQILWLPTHELEYIHAINTSALQVAFAREKIRRAGLDDAILFELADLEFTQSNLTYDCVVSLDAAYHIRKSLLFQASRRLTKDDGRLAFTDFVLDSGSKKFLSNLFLRFICAGGGVPYSDLSRAEGLRQGGRSVGWICARFQDISDAVLGGYARFMRENRRRIFRQHGLRGLRFIVTGLMLELILRLKLLRYVVVVFERR
jgi:cyclopropane fatty-acyl-phospholipid synthase-like methyltransferase